MTAEDIRTNPQEALIGEIDQTGFYEEDEIERKFILFSLPSTLAQCDSVEIEQGYSDGYRYRVEMHTDGSRHYFMTLKIGEGVARKEKSKALSKEQFDGIWPSTEGKRVYKTRYFVPLDHGLVAHLDVYKESLKGRFTVEVEFPSLDSEEGFKPPVWFGDSNGKIHEVTGDKRYSNKSLAKNGWPVNG